MKLSYETILAVLDSLFDGERDAYKEQFLCAVFSWAIKKTFSSDLYKLYIVKDVLGPMLESCGYELVERKWE